MTPARLGHQMDETSALELFKLYSTAKVEAFKLHRTTLQQNLAFSVALIGAVVAAIINIPNFGLPLLALVFVPILNISICMLAIRMCNRYYLGALEKIAILMKLEPLVGLRDSRPKVSDEGGKVALPQDKFFVPNRWIDAEIDERFPTTESFTDFHMSSGVNLLAKRTFELVIAINCVIILYLVFLIAAPFGRP